MDIEDFLKSDHDDQKVNVDVGLALIRILEQSHKNKTLLLTVLKKQLELSEQLKGQTESEYDEIVMTKLEEIVKTAYEVSDESYRRVLREVLSPLDS